MSHTPTIDLYNGVCAPKDAQFLVDRLGCSLNRAAFIVKAVNMHEELMEAVKAVAHAKTERQFDEAIQNCQALAATEGK